VRRSTVLSVAVVFIAVAFGPPAAAQDARTVAMVHARLAAAAQEELERQHILLREAWASVNAGNKAIQDAHAQGADLESVQSLEDELQQQEALLLMRLVEVQRARRDIATNRAAVDAAGGSIRSRMEQLGPLTGKWELVVQPGLKGAAYLVQQGTLITGTYELSGGWTGSLRGTLVADKVRLERIDSQLGFVAIFYGEVNMRAEPDTMQGRWEATQLATGLPSAGGWSAKRQD